MRKVGFNLCLEIIGAKHPVRFGGLPDALKHLGVDVHPKQIAVRGLALGGLLTKPEIIFVRLNQGGQSVRDRLDEDAFRVLYKIPEHHRSLSGRMPIEHQHLDALITALAAFAGILTMIRGQSFAFLEIGRRLERAPGLCATLRATLLRDPPYSSSWCGIIGRGEFLRVVRCRVWSRKMGGGCTGNWSG